MSAASLIPAVKFAAAVEGSLAVDSWHPVTPFLPLAQRAAFSGSARARPPIGGEEEEEEGGRWATAAATGPPPGRRQS